MSLLDRLRSMRGRAGATSAAAAVPIDAPAPAAVEAEYQARLQALEGVRRSIADVMASRRRLEAQAEELRREIEKLQARASASAKNGHDDLARSALMESVEIERRLAKRLPVVDGLRAQEHELAESSAKLQTQLEDYRVRVEAARARAAAAEASAAWVPPRPDGPPTS
jgi:phage shock protein A